MGNLKIVDRNYSTSNADEAFVSAMDEKMLGYITNPQKAIDHLVFGANILLGTPADMAKQFKVVRRIFHKEDGRLLRHFIISFAENEGIDAIQAFYYGIHVLSYYASRYQIILGVHQDTKNTHIHFLMNTVSYIDGSKFSEGISELSQFVHYLNVINPAITIGKHKTVIIEE